MTFFLSTGKFSNKEKVLESYKGYENQVVFVVWEDEEFDSTSFKHIIKVPLKEQTFKKNSCNFQICLIKHGLNYIKNNLESSFIVKIRNDISINNIKNLIEYISNITIPKIHVLSYIRNYINYYTDFVMCGQSSLIFDTFLKLDYITYDDYPELFFIGTNRNSTISDLKKLLYFMKKDLKERDVDFVWHRNSGEIKLIKDYCDGDKKVSTEKTIEINNEEVSFLKDKKTEFKLPITVNLSYFGYSSPQLILQESSIHFMCIKDNDISFSLNDEHDFSVIINYPSPSFKHTLNRTILFSNEPTLYDPKDIFKGPKNVSSEYFSNIVPKNFLKVEGPKGNSLGLVQWMFNTDIQSFSFEKSKNMSAIISEKNVDEGHIVRREFIKKYKDLLDIDVFGRCKELAFKGELTKEEKWIGYAPYKYFFSVENNRENNYITEKLFEPILCECLTFYCGAPNVSSFIDPRSYIYIDPVNMGYEETYQLIKKSIEESEWDKRLPYIREMKRKIINKLSFFPRVERILMKETFVFLEGVDQLELNECLIKKCEDGCLYTFKNMIENEVIKRKKSAYNTKCYIKKEIKNLTPVSEGGLFVNIKILKNFIKEKYTQINFENEKENRGLEKGILSMNWSNKIFNKDLIYNYIIPIISLYRFLYGKDFFIKTYYEKVDKNLKQEIEKKFNIFFIKI